MMLRFWIVVVSPRQFLNDLLPLAKLAANEVLTIAVNVYDQLLGLSGGRQDFADLRKIQFQLRFFAFQF